MDNNTSKLKKIKIEGSEETEISNIIKKKSGPINIRNISIAIIIAGLIFTYLITSKIIPIEKILKKNSNSNKNLKQYNKKKGNLLLTKNNASHALNENVGLNSNYAKIEPNHKNYTYIPIIGIDDVHGVFFPKVNNLKLNNNKTLIYKTGGLEYVAKYINILREEFGPERVLFFDGGDFYQGGIDSVLSDGEIMQDFYNLI